MLNWAQATQMDSETASGRLIITSIHTTFQHLITHLYNDENLSDIFPAHCRTLDSKESILCTHYAFIDKTVMSLYYINTFPSLFRKKFKR